MFIGYAFVDVLMKSCVAVPFNGIPKGFICVFILCLFYYLNYVFHYGYILISIGVLCKSPSVGVMILPTREAVDIFTPIPPPATDTC